MLLIVSSGVVLNTYGSPVPQNLGNGLNKILENSLLQAGTIQPPAPLGNAQPTQAYVDAYKAAVLKQANAFDARAIKEAVTGKYMVDIMPSGQVPVATLQSQLQAAFPAFSVQHTDLNYAGHGAIEGYITLTDAAGISKFAGVASVILQLKPIHSVGAVTSQGINQHRVNRINTIYNPAASVNYDGTGMSIGVMSDSYNSQPSAEGGFTTAPADVATQDLPGTGNVTNSQPVVVLEDYNPTPGATNEGRGMCQIVADMAPKARIGFATADTGEIGFANNIRALAGLPGFTKDPATQQGFKGDVVCDDVSYLDEPMFQDGIVAQGVIDVVNAGTTYCSSAANNWGTDGYASVFRPVVNGTGLTAGAGNAALAGTNIDLTGVDPALYVGGFHNFNPNAGQQDIAQLFNESSDPQAAVFQWDDPYDTAIPTLGALIFGPVTGDSEPAPLGSPNATYPVTLTAGQAYVITEKATPPPTDPTENFDAKVAVIDPNGRTIIDQDTGVDETVVFFAPISGSYGILVHPFATTPPIIGQPAVNTRGHYSLQVNQATGTPRITQDFNLLFFDTNGNFLEAVATPNFANNRPYEIWVPNLSSHGQVQLVISRANATAPANAATHLKYVFFGNGAAGMGPAEYNSYLSPVTFGHSAAAGANSVAAYAMFRPNLPEDFTSPGPVTIYFDTNNNRLATPQVRLKPDIAAADGANNTFFPLGPAQDVPWDIDTAFANFYGTSAASPHSAAIAALVIQAHKPTILTPAQVKTLMQLNAFPHDLDPYFSSGTASAHDGTVTISITSDNDSNNGTGANDSNAWSVTYSGSGYVKELHFNTNGIPAEGGNPTGGNYTGGAGTGTPTEYSDFLNAANYKFTPGLVFDPTKYVNGTRSDLTGSATFTHPATSPPGTVGTYDWTLNVAFPTSSFIAGKTFRFNIGRAQDQDANTPQGFTEENGLYGQPNTYSADMLGSGILIPEYADNPVVLPGMTFSGVVTDGGTDYPFSGRISNKVGKGYSPLDGYGFVNAQAATTGVLPTAGVVSRKVHSTAGTFDIPLPAGPAAAGIECRAAGPNNSFQLVYTFDQPVATAGSAAITQGTGDQPTTLMGPEPNQVTVNLTGVTNAQHLIVTLSDVHNGSDAVLAAVPTRMDVLFGDVNATGRTDSGDVTVIRNQTVSIPTQSNFRLDVNCSGRIDSGDVTVTRNASVTALP